MSVYRPRPRLHISHGPRKKVDFTPLSNLGNLSPDLSPSPPVFSRSSSDSKNVSKIGEYFILDQVDGELYNALNSQTKEKCQCKIFPINKYREILRAYSQGDSHDNINSISEIILGEAKAYVFFPQHYGDLHSYVRQKKRLREEEASRLFKQIVSAVRHCHENGLVLRDLKLRKFVFRNPERTQLRLDGLEDAYILEDEFNDKLTDKHGCPAYVSPEILNANESYSGRSADIWSLGVMLYTMLVGRYPFHDSEPTALFGKIRRGQFTIPRNLSSKAKCLIKSILRRDPSERLLSSQVLQHPWIRGPGSGGFLYVVDDKCPDQTVPEVKLTCDEDSIF